MNLHFHPRFESENEALLLLLSFTSTLLPVGLLDMLSQVNED